MVVRQYDKNPFRVGQSPFPAVGLQPPPGYDLASWRIFQAVGIFRAFQHASHLQQHGTAPALRHRAECIIPAMAVLYSAVACLG